MALAEAPLRYSVPHYPLLFLYKYGRLPIFRRDQSHINTDGFQSSAEINPIYTRRRPLRKRTIDRVKLLYIVAVSVDVQELRVILHVRSFAETSIDDRS